MPIRKKYLQRFLGCVLTATALFATACSNDDEVQPAYKFDLAELSTNASGVATALTLDDGTSLTLNQPIGGMKADTTFRIQALYVASDNGTASVSDYAQVLSPQVVRYAEADIKTDALDVLTCWQTAHYVNFRLAVKGTAVKVHYLGFHETNYVHNADGTVIMQVLLIHDQNNDPLYYTRETYLSLPFRPLSGLLRAGTDSLHVTVATFDGNKTYKFLYQ